MSITIYGKKGIRATVLADSLSAITCDRFTSLEIEYPRLLLAEFNTHRMLAKNSHSSRAIPFAKMLDQLVAEPVRFGQANPGMQDKGADYDAPVSLRPHDGDEFISMTPSEAWQDAKTTMAEYAREFYEAGYAKQVFNRLTEPFQMMKTVVSATEWGNFFWLRRDEAADPSLQELANVMYEAINQSTPTLLYPGEYHLPYVYIAYDDNHKLRYFIADADDLAQELTLEQAIKVSAARSAAVSFRNVDYGLEKCLEVHDRLVGDERKHGSAMEHQATPMKAQFGDEYGVNFPTNPLTWEEGISHMTRDKRLWSGPLRGFIQYRKLIPGECYNGPIQLT